MGCVQSIALINSITMEDAGEILEDLDPFDGDDEDEEGGGDGDEEEEKEEEEEEEEKEETEKAKENVGSLKKSLSLLKEIDLPHIVKSFAKFVVQNDAIGLIMYGVNVAMNKILKKSHGAEKHTIQRKKKKVKALAQLTTNLHKALDKLTKWAKEKKDVMVTVDAGIEIPLPDLLKRFTKSLEKVSALLRVKF